MNVQRVHDGQIIKQARDFEKASAVLETGAGGDGRRGFDRKEEA